MKPKQKIKDFRVKHVNDKNFKSGKYTGGPLPWDSFLSRQSYHFFIFKILKRKGTSISKSMVYEASIDLLFVASR